jgi:hypothetical protein
VAGGNGKAGIEHEFELPGRLFGANQVPHLKRAFRGINDDIELVTDVRKRQAGEDNEYD